MANVLTIYGRALSPFVARVQLAARAKGFKYELTLPKDGIKSSAYLKLNPFGKIPVLKDGKTAVFESSVILEYLEAKSRTKKLVPSNAKAAGQVRLVAAVAAEYVQMPAVKLMRNKRGVGEPINVEATIAELNKGLDALAQTMPSGKYASGAKFSLADCYAAPALMFVVGVAEAFGLGDCFAARPKVSKYWKAIQKDKIAKPVLDEMRVAIQLALSGQLPPLR